MTGQTQTTEAATAGPLAGYRIGVSANTSWNILNFRMSLIRRLIAEGADVFVLSPPDDSVEEIKRSGVTYLPINGLGRKGTNPLRDYQLMRELRRLYRDNKLDLVFQYTIKNVIYGCFASRPLATRTVSTITGLGYAFLSKSWMQKVVSMLYRGALIHCERVIFQNQDDRALFTSKKLVPQSKTQIIRGSGVNTAHFAPVERPASENLRFLFVGRLLSDKGVHELLHAAEKAMAAEPKLEFHFVGDIDDGNPASLTREQQQQWSSQPNFHFHGYNSDVKTFVADCDVVILPSYREGLPRVLLEGMSMGKACITTDVPGCHDTVDDGITGYVVQPKSAEEIASAILKMARLPREKLAEMGRAGREKVLATFSDKIVVDSYIELLQNILNVRNN